MKKTALYILLVGCMFLLCACSVQKEDKAKLRDIDFTVVDAYDAPEELQKKIEEKKEKTFEISYADNGYLYVVRGYGSQDTSGYSVEVKECFEAKDGIYLKTNLLGPPKSEEIIEGKTYPYVIVKMEYSDKNVVFD